MTQIEEILKSKMNAKERTFLLAAKLKENCDLMGELIESFSSYSIANRGTCVEAIAHITENDPKFAEKYLDFIIEQIDDPAPRVKWEASSVIANIAKEFPDRAARAIPELLINTKHEGTVVRWSAARALTEIAKNNPKAQAKLTPIFNEIIAREENNGVKNNYVKAMKIFAKKN